MGLIDIFGGELCSLFSLRILLDGCDYVTRIVAEYSRTRRRPHKLVSSRVTFNAITGAVRLKPLTPLSPKHIEDINTFSSWELRASSYVTELLVQERLFLLSPLSLFRFLNFLFKKGSSFSLSLSLSLSLSIV
jgi:hypothetical protein